MIRKLTPTIASLLGFVLTATVFVTSNIITPANAVATHGEIRIIR
jgi:hypothetical protein